MTIDQLIVFDTIVKSGSFKSASELLFKTQPSLSMAIKKLEEEYGLELFNREGYRPELTEHGKNFLKQTQKVLKQFNKLDQLAKELSAGYEAEIKICIDAIFPICKLSPIFKNFFEPHITTKLNLSTDVLEGVYKNIREHKVDFALGPKMDNDPNLEKIKILDCKIIPVISKQHIHQNEVTLELLQNLPQVVVPSSDPQQHGVIRGAISDNFWYASDFFMKEQLIKAGLGWGRLPEHQIRHQLKNNELAEIKGIPEITSATVLMYLIRSKTKVLGPNTKNLWEFLKKAELKDQI